MAERFDIDKAISSLAGEERLIAINELRILPKDVRQQIRSLVAQALQDTYADSGKYNAESFDQTVNEHASLSPSQINLARELYCLVAPNYRQWAKDTELLSEQPVSFKHRETSSLHGGSGYTGRLPVGHAAPYGSDLASKELAGNSDDPWQGTRFVQELTARVGGAASGPGYSPGEIAGKRFSEPKNAGGLINNDQRRKYENLLNSSDAPRDIAFAVLRLNDRSTHVDLTKGNRRAHFSVGNTANEFRIPELVSFDMLYDHLLKVDVRGYFTKDLREKYLQGSITQVDEYLEANQNKRYASEDDKEVVRLVNSSRYDLVDLMEGLEKPIEQEVPAVTVARPRFSHKGVSLGTGGLNGSGVPDELKPTSDRPNEHLARLGKSRLTIEGETTGHEF